LLTHEANQRDVLQHEVTELSQQRDRPRVCLRAAQDALRRRENIGQDIATDKRRALEAARERQLVSAWAAERDPTIPLH